MPIYRNFYQDRASYSSGNCALKFTVTQEGHPKLGQGFELNVWTGLTVTTDAKSTALTGNGAWPVTHSSTMAEGPTFEIQDVPWEERIRFAQFIGDGNGPAGTIGTWECIMQLPGLAADKLTIEGCKNESLANLSMTREGTVETMGGPMRRVLVNDIDPLRQDF